MTEPPTPAEARLMRVGRGLRGALNNGSLAPSTSELDQGFDRLQLAMEKRRSRRRGASYALASALMIAFASTGGYLAWPDPDLTFATTADNSSGYIRVDADAPAASVDFSDGTQMLVQPESQARIAEVTANGARVALEGGSVRLKVQPRPGAQWSVEAGPYRILVTGTEFEVHWRTPADVLEVVLHEGSVEVEGPLTNRGIRVAAGEQLVANLKRSELKLMPAAVAVAANDEPADDSAVAFEGEGQEVNESAGEETVESTSDSSQGAGEGAGLSDDPDVTTASVEATGDDGDSVDSGDELNAEGAETSATASEATPEDVARTQANKPSRRASAAQSRKRRIGIPESKEAPGRPSWVYLMRRSQYGALVSDAESRGLDSVLSSVSLGDLTRLADAARYSGNSRIASRAWLAQRERFSGTPQSRSAAFMLGRLAEDNFGDAKTALSWYTTYLQESPSGSFASQALGRKMQLTQRTRGRVAATSLARAYLTRYPQGPYATTARKIISP